MTAESSSGRKNMFPYEDLGLSLWSLHRKPVEGKLHKWWTGALVSLHFLSLSNHLYREKK